MNELLEKEQVISVVPQDFRHSNKGKVVNILERSFVLELFHAPEGLETKKIMEFYSQTKHGTLYFSSAIAKIDENIILVLMPKKHRFLQRRNFSRVKFVEDLSLILGNSSYKITSLDISAGGMKIKTDENIDINSDYNLGIKLPGGECIKTIFQPIKIEKNDNKSYIVAGRFVDLSPKDKMKIIQFCMRKNIENANR